MEVVFFICSLSDIIVWELLMNSVNAFLSFMLFSYGFGAVSLWSVFSLVLGPFSLWALDFLGLPLGLCLEGFRVLCGCYYSLILFKVLCIWLSMIVWFWRAFSKFSLFSSWDICRLRFFILLVFRASLRMWRNFLSKDFAEMRFWEMSSASGSKIPMTCLLLLPSSSIIVKCLGSFWSRLIPVPWEGFLLNTLFDAVFVLIDVGLFVSCVGSDSLNVLSYLSPS